MSKPESARHLDTLIAVRVSPLVAWAAGAVLSFSPAAQAATIVDDSGTLRNAKVGTYSSIVASSDGQVAISYYCETDTIGPYSLRFAWQTGSTWQWTTVDSGCGWYSSMARGSDGVYYIVSAASSGVRWAYGSGTDWMLGEELVTSTAPELTTMALDAQNRPHVAFMNFTDAGEYALVYTWWDGTAWAPLETVATGIWWPSLGNMTRYLALDSTDTPHLVFGGPGNEIKHSKRVGGTWQDENVGLGTVPTLTIAPGDSPCVVYNDLNAGLVYAYKAPDGEHWLTEPIAEGAWGGFPTVALSTTGVPYAAFSLGTNEDLYLATRGPSGWSLDMLDGDGSPSSDLICGRLGISIAVDSSDQPHVSYAATTTYQLNGWPEYRADLRYAPSAPTTPGDLNCDGLVDFGDINPFTLALSDPAAYQAAFPNCDWLNGDCDGNGLVDFGDINPFVALLSSQ